MDQNHVLYSLVLRWCLGFSLVFDDTVDLVLLLVVGFGLGIKELSYCKNQHWFEYLSISDDCLTSGKCEL